MPVNQEIVESLEWLLKGAKDGKVTGLAVEFCWPDYAYPSSEGDRYCWRSSNMPGGPVSPSPTAKASFILGALEAAETALKPFAAFADPRRTAPDALLITHGSTMAKRQLSMGNCYVADRSLTAIREAIALVKQP